MEGPTVHDREFYIDTADCIIRVENTLFKVHQYFIGRDLSAFRDMFNIPAGTQGVEGRSDENPVRLYGESVERFRALLSVIYATPLQLGVYSTPAADLEKLLVIVDMTNKYHFTSFETWAVGALHHVVSGLHGPPQAQYDLGSCSSQWMKRLAEVALLCSHTTLLTLVAERWVDRIVTRELRPVHALDIADSSGIRQFQGYVYYVQLLEMDDTFEPGVVEDGTQYSRFPSAPTTAGPNGTANGDTVAVVASTRAGTPASLTREHRERLLFGYWSLSRLWDNLRSNPPNLPQSTGCTMHQTKCVPGWMQAWRALGELTVKHSAGDVLGRLRAMKRHLAIDGYIHGLLDELTFRCRWSTAEVLKTTIKNVEEGLADHFMPSRKY